MRFTSFRGKRGNFTANIEGETVNLEAVVFGVTEPDEFEVCQEIPLDWRNNEVNHSPTGLEWGYGGSGPAQLAWCLLREVGLTKPQTQSLYQLFKAEVIATFSHTAGFDLTREQILEWVKKQPAPKPTKTAEG